MTDQICFGGKADPGQLRTAGSMPVSPQRDPWPGHRAGLSALATSWPPGERISHSCVLMDHKHPPSNLLVHNPACKSTIGEKHLTLPDRSRKSLEQLSTRCKLRKYDGRTNKTFRRGCEALPSKPQAGRSLRNMFLRYNTPRV